MDALNVFVIDAAAQWWVYPVLLVCCFVDGFFPPIPSESVVVALAALAVSSGAPNPWLVALVAAAGAIAGDNVAFLIGRKVGTRGFRWMQRPRVISAFAWARKELDRRGALLILSARYIPIGRVAVNMTAGATGFDQRKFIFFSVIAGISWSAYSIAIGALAGQWFHDHSLIAAGIAIVLALLLGVLVDHGLKLAYRRRARKAKHAGEAGAAARSDQAGELPGDAREDASAA
jgi:membrane-associated protein